MKHLCISISKDGREEQIPIDLKRLIITFHDLSNNGNVDVRHLENIIDVSFRENIISFTLKDSRTPPQK